MGRWYYNKKEEADDLKKIEVWWLKKYGYLEPDIWHKAGGISWTFGWSGNKHSVGFYTSTVSSDDRNPHIEFSYTQTEPATDEKKEFKYRVQLISTPCRYGGIRWWFVCPLLKNGQPCNRRVGVLYKGGDYFGCRHCYELTYESRNKNRRYYMQPIFDFLMADKKTEEIEKTMKRSYYQGKPTRKMRRILKINQKMNSQASVVNRLLKK